MNSEITKTIGKLGKYEVNFCLSLMATIDYSVRVPNSAKYLISCLKNSNNEKLCFDNLYHFMTLNKVNNDYFDDIENDLRYAIWLDNLYRHWNDNSIPKGYQIPAIHFIDKLIIELNGSKYFPHSPAYPHLHNQNLDYTDFNYAVQGKENYLINAKLNYQRIKTETKKLSWLNSRNEEQLYWAKEYLQKARILYTPCLFIPKSNEELYLQICASLDIMDIPTLFNTPISNLDNQNQAQNLSSANKLMFISKMKKAWSQKKFRNNKDMDSAQDFLLSKESKYKLKELAKKRNIEIIEVLENLINEAHKKI